eukprot:TRINITY_DN9259_c0_g1_i4.p1 TRINITY_DN9259_c0_g1~~TRINITY_DN9259_c0_g1_i4.p1  ORF type:complete len:280 (+),score=29.80 TRINITY_DN9259_c0_g1_i4:220-1059(+)
MIARGILDRKVVNVKVCEVFWKLALEQNVRQLDLEKIDKEKARMIRDLFALVREQKRRQKQKQSVEHLQQQVEGLCLNFVMPGNEYIEMKSNGMHLEVNLANLEEYLHLLIKFITFESIKCQVNKFREGFNQVFPINNLRNFNGEELTELYYGDALNSNWQLSYLQKHILPSHGYTTESRIFQQFLQLLAGFHKQKRKQFIKFITGSEHLPSGGFQNLNPKVTVVKACPSTQNQKPDQLIPSVMTCQNYIKLPDYSSAEILNNKLAIAITEGLESFTLS